MIDLDSLRGIVARAAGTGWQAAYRQDVAALIAEVERLRAELDAAEKERDQWIDAAMYRRQALHDADSLMTGVRLALSPDGGVNGWRPSRGVDALIDLALDVREGSERYRAEAQEQRADAAFLRACVPPTHPRDYGYEAWEERLRAEVERERAGVVAWLRECEVRCSEHDGRENAVSATYRIAANAIERGEHRREEEK